MLNLASADLKNGPLKTRSDTFLTVEEALVTTADVRASNGVIQVVDKVLIPPAR